MENKKYYIIGAAVLVLLIILGIVFFAGSGDKKPRRGNVELTWWKTFDDQETVSELISEYQKINKGITINFVKKDVVDYEQELLDALAAGRGPDILTIHNDWLPKHMDKLTPAPTDLISLRVFQETFADVVASDFISDGKIYAVPLSLDVLALYYNKDILGSNGISSPPKTWPELVAAVEKITTQSSPGEFLRSGVAMGTSDNVNRAVDILLLLMLQNGTEFYSPDLGFAKFDQTKISSDNQNYNPGALALEFYTQFSNPAKKTYTWNQRSDFSVDAFTQGRAAMMISFAYMRPVIKAKSPNLNWGVAPVPQIDATDSKVNFANYWGEAVSKASPNFDVAWDFLNFISQKEILQKYYEKRELPSSRKDILAAQISDPQIGVFAESALTARSVYKKDTNQFETIFLKMIDDVVLRNFKPVDAVRSAAQQINLGLRK